MGSPRVVSREEWVIARRELLTKEKEATRARDALSAERRELPMVRVEKDYVFDGPDGPVSLLDLFEQRRQLIVYHFMFDPSWDAGCRSCSYLVDNIGHLSHLHARDTSLVLVSRAPKEKIAPFQERMGWSVPWYSSFGNDFNYDFQATVDASLGSAEYNFQDISAFEAAGMPQHLAGEQHGLSVFLRDDDSDGESVLHSYSTYQRGPDLLLGTYNYLDLTPLGRQENNKEEFTMAWLRHHDSYSNQA